MFEHGSSALQPVARSCARHARSGVKGDNLSFSQWLDCLGRRREGSEGLTGQEMTHHRHTSCSLYTFGLLWYWLFFQSRFCWFFFSFLVSLGYPKRVWENQLTWTWLVSFLAVRLGSWRKKKKWTWSELLLQDFIVASFAFVAWIKKAVLDWIPPLGCCCCSASFQYHRWPIPVWINAVGTR